MPQETSWTNKFKDCASPRPTRSKAYPTQATEEVLELNPSRPWLDQLAQVLLDATGSPGPTKTYSYPSCWSSTRANQPQSRPWLDHQALLYPCSSPTQGDGFLGTSKGLLYPSSTPTQRDDHQAQRFIVEVLLDESFFSPSALFKLFLSSYRRYNSTLKTTAAATIEETLAYLFSLLVWFFVFPSWSGKEDPREPHVAS